MVPTRRTSSTSRSRCACSPPKSPRRWEHRQPQRSEPRDLTPTATARKEHVMNALTQQFIAAFRNHPAGVALVTADAGAGPVAMTATSVCSVDADPPTVAFSASTRSSSTPTLLRASTVVVHLLSARQLDLAQLGATSGVDRFADTSLWQRL